MRNRRKVDCDLQRERDDGSCRVREVKVELSDEILVEGVRKKYDEDDEIRTVMMLVRPEEKTQRVQREI